MATQSKAIHQQSRRFLGALGLCLSCALPTYAADNSGPASPAPSASTVAAKRAPTDLEAAYAAMQEGDDRAALQAFDRAFLKGVGGPGNLMDAGNAAVRLGDNPLAMSYYKRGLDVDARQRALNDTQRFAFRRQMEELERGWGILLGASYQTEAFSTQGTIASLVPSFEAYWQPPVIGYRNGRIFQLFVRAYGSAYDGSGDVAGLPTTQASVGALYKPLVDQNIVFSFERLIRVGRLSLNDWLAQLSYSTEAGTDLQVAVPDWRSWQVFANAAYFLKQGRYILSAEMRYGHTWRMHWMHDRLTFYPHVALAGDYDNAQPNRAALGIGPGIGIRYWFREGRYTAPASSLDVTVQYRFPLTQAVRARGLIVRATLAF